MYSFSDVAHTLFLICVMVRNRRVRVRVRFRVRVRARVRVRVRVRVRIKVRVRCVGDGLTTDEGQGVPFTIRTRLRFIGCTFNVCLKIDGDKEERVRVKMEKVMVKVGGRG